LSWSKNKRNLSNGSALNFYPPLGLFVLFNQELSGTVLLLVLTLLVATTSKRTICAGILARGSKRSSSGSLFQVEGSMIEKARRCLRDEWAQGTRSSRLTEERRAHRRNHPMGPVGRVPPNFRTGWDGPPTFENF